MIYFYFGDNIYELEQKLSLFKDRYHKKFPSGLNFFNLDLAGDNERLKEIVETQSMFDEKKLVFARDATELTSDSWDSVEKVIKYSKLKTSEDIVVVFYDKKPSDEIDKRKKAFKYLKNNAKTEEFKTPTGVRLLSWIKSETKKLGGSINDGAVRELSQRVGPNTLRLVSETEKLITYKGGKKVEKTDVENLVNRTVDPNVFETLDSLARRDVPTAIRFLHEHFEKGDEPIQLLGMFAYQIRTLLLVKEESARSTNPASLARDLKIHPFVVQKTLGFARNFSVDELVQMHNLLAQADIDIKTGKKEPELALEDFIYSFL